MANIQDSTKVSDHSHAHHHAHHDHHGHEQSHTEKNLAHWDKSAKTYNSDHTQKDFGDLINKTTEFVLSNISEIGVDFVEPSSTFEGKDSQSSQKSVRVLDYACGPGTITNILAGRATAYVGLDLSPNMVAEYNNRFSSEPDGERINAKAYVANLIGSEERPEAFASPEFSDFDLVAVGYGFHHFENLPTVTQRLADRLRPGGVLLILDFFTHDKEDMQGHEAAITVSHHGFSEAQISTLFTGAGLEEVKVIPYPGEITMRKHSKRQPFMARARKPA